jgi:hypothetical protein
MLEKKDRPGHSVFMTDTQLYLAVGLPVLAILMSFLGTTFQFGTVNSRITSSETSTNARITSLENTMNARITSLENGMNARFVSLENRMSSLEARFETLIGKVIEIDNRR